MSTELTMTFNHIESTDALKLHAEERVERLSKYVTYPLKLHLIVSVEKQEQIAELTCHAEHKELVALAKSENLYGSIDSAVEKMEAQLRKERDKRKGHHKGHELKRSSGEKLDVDAEIPHRNKP